jgi:hypothetical protein
MKGSMKTLPAVASIEPLISCSRVDDPSGRFDADQGRGSHRDAPLGGPTAGMGADLLKRDP